MSESEFRNREVLPTLRNFGIVKYVENSIGDSTPDLVYCLRRTLSDGPGKSGWIELKHSPHWPARPHTIFRFKHYTAEQADWLHEWGIMSGGRAWLLAKVASEYLLVPWDRAKEVQRGVTRQRFYDVSEARGQRTFPVGRILLCLTR